ncbi:MAG: TlpA disulfide reductase family protein [Bacteroidales bacterium]|nr:TlpA family protein disulfide reductase [Bacteroidales bacterium]
MKRILTALLFLIGFTTVFAAETIIERPPFSVSNTSTLEVDKIILTDTATVMYMKVFFTPKYWISINSKSYILANGQKLEMKRAQGIELDKHVFMDDSGKTSFILTFPPINPDTKQIDFIESDCESCFKIWGIELKSKTLTNRMEVPQEIQNEAKKREAKEMLGIPEFKADSAVLKGKFYGYIPEMKFKIQVYVNNPITGEEEDYETAVNENGCFEKKIPLICTTQVIFRSNSYNKDILLTPGKETSVYFDLQKKCQQEANLRVDKCEATNDVFFGGANASVNNQLSTTEINPQEDREQMLKDILGMSPEQYKTYILERNNQAITKLNQKNLSPDAFLIAKLSQQYFTLYKLMYANSYLQDAFRKANNLSYKDPMKGFVIPVFDSDYYSFLKIFPVNNPISLYCEDYNSIISSCKYLNRQTNNIRLDYLTAPMIQKLMKSEDLTAEDKECAQYLIKEDFNNWDYKRIAQYKQMTLDNCKQLIKTGKLTQEEKTQVEKFMNQTKVKDTKVIDIINSRLKLLQYITKNNPDFPKDLLIPLQKEVGISQDTAIQKRVQAFRQKYKTKIQDIQLENTRKNDLEYLARILGTDQGILFDLIQTMDYTSQLNNFSPLSDETLQKISSMGYPFYGKYFTGKNQELIAKIEANKNKKGYTVHETPSTSNDSLFAEILKPFAGKVILVDFWATWCSPCRRAMKELEPAKENFKGKDVAFLYLACENSPIDTWKNMIPGIPGEHFRITNDQYNYLSKKFGVKGIPSYMIIDKKGEQVYFNVGFEGVDKITDLLNKELDK